MTVPAKNGGYGINNYLTAQFTLGGYTLPFFPGIFAPENSPDSFVMFRVKPFTGFEYYMVHTDHASYVIYHTSYDAIQDLANIALASFNVENIQSVTALSETGIVYMSSNAVINDVGESVFIEGNDYYTAMLDVTFTFKIVG